MTFTRQVTPLVRPDEKIHHLVISEEGEYLAWSEGKEKVILASITEENSLETIKVIDHPHPVSTVHFHRSQLIIADEIEGFSIHDVGGEFPRASSGRCWCSGLLFMGYPHCYRRWNGFCVGWSIPAST